MEYRNQPNPARTPCDGEDLHRVLVETSAGIPCGCARRDMSCRKPDHCADVSDEKPRMQNASPMARRSECADTDTCMNEQKNVAPLRRFPLAMVYSPHQEWQKLYEPEEAMSRGTLFSELDYPWYPTACDRSCGCRKEDAR